MDNYIENTATYIDSEAVLKVRDALRKIRFETAKQKYDLKQAASSDVRIGYLGGKVVKRLVVTLRSSGCGWGENNSGCSMCVHYAGTTRGEKLTVDDFLTQFIGEIRKYDFSKIPILCLYNAGSILNTAELPARALGRICKEISRLTEIKKVVFETRSEYVTDDAINNIKSELGEKSVEIAMGLESSSEDVRMLCLNKGLDMIDFLRAVNLIKAHFGFRLYIMIKPLFLTEAEAIKDAVSSFHFADSLQPSEIHFEPATIQEHTLSSQLFKKGLYRPPWLWSIIETIRRLPRGKRVYISPFAHTPSPVVVPHNCPKCTARVTKAIIDDYNKTFDVSVFDGLSCDCMADYKKELHFFDARRINERIIQILK